MIQQPPSYNFLITRSHHRPNNNYKKKSLPSVLIGKNKMNWNFILYSILDRFHSHGFM